MANIDKIKQASQAKTDGSKTIPDLNPIKAKTTRRRESKPSVGIPESEYVKVRVTKKNAKDMEAIMTSPDTTILINKNQGYTVPNTKQVKKLIEVKRIEIVK